MAERFATVALAALSLVLGPACGNDEPVGSDGARLPSLGTPRVEALVEGAELTERLLGWTDASIREDLRAHNDVEPSDAIATRDRLLELVKAEATR